MQAVQTVGAFVPSRFYTIAIVNVEIASYCWLCCRTVGPSDVDACVIFLELSISTLEASP
jgi:hypothetical protein